MPLRSNQLNNISAQITLSPGKIKKASKGHRTSLEGIWFAYSRNQFAWLFSKSRENDFSSAGGKQSHV